jgi:hypothetical protein
LMRNVDAPKPPVKRMGQNDDKIVLLQ